MKISDIIDALEAEIVRLESSNSSLVKEKSLVSIKKDIETLKNCKSEINRIREKYQHIPLKGQIFY